MGGDDDLARVVLGKRRGRIDFVVHLLRQRQHRGIRHGRVVEIGQREIAGGQRGRNDIRDAELRVITVLRAHLGGHWLAHRLHHFLGHQRAHRTDVGRGDAVLLANDRGGVGAAVGEVASRDRLDGDFRHFPDFAQTSGSKTEIAIFGKRAEIAVEDTEAAFVGFARADKTVARQRRRCNTGDRCPAGMHALGPGTVLQEFEAA